MFLNKRCVISFNLFVDGNSVKQTFQAARMPVTGFHKIVFFIIMMAYFCEQMDNWNFGFIAPALKCIGWVNFLYSLF